MTSCSKLTWLAALVSVFCCCSISITACVSSGDNSVRIRSPKATYTVDITGNLLAPKSLFTLHLVRADVARSDGTSIGRVPLYEGDSLDAGFSSKFGAPDWPAENVVRFPLAGTRSTRMDAQLIIENRTNRTVTCLSVRAADLFLVFDVAPHARIVLATSPQPASELAYLGASVWFAPGEPFREELRNFTLTKPSDGWHGKHLVIVEDTDIILELEPSQRPWPN